MELRRERGLGSDIYLGTFIIDKAKKANNPPVLIFMNVQFRRILKDESYFAPEQHLLEMEALCAALNTTTRISSPDSGSSDR